MTRKTQLHEILAVEPDILKVTTGVLEEAKHTFKNKANLFTGAISKYEAFAEDDETNGHTTAQELETTVNEKLNYVFSQFAKLINVVGQKEKANQEAKGDIVIGENTIALDVPVSMLLNLGHRIKELRNACQAIPTLAPGIDWQVDTSHTKASVYKSNNPDTKYRTKKITTPVVLYKHTDKHPAQVKEVSEDINTGRIHTEHWSGMISSSKKSQLLQRIDDLDQAIKQARMRANTQEVKVCVIGDSIRNYLSDII